MSTPQDRLAAADADLAGLSVLVAGAGRSGAAAARALLGLGAAVTVTDRTGGDRLSALVGAGARTAVGIGSPPPGTTLVVTSPGWRPDHPLLVAAGRAGLPVIGEVELAWLLGQRSAAGPAPWLALTGTNGKTTAVRMLASMLTAGGYRAVAVGNVGRPVVEAVLADPPFDVLAVELSSFQLHWSPSPRPRVAAVLNVAEDHLDWHGSMRAYAADKGRIYHPGAVNVFNADDRCGRRLVEGFADAVGFTLGVPGPGRLGVRGGVLVDRAFERPEGSGAGVELALVADVRPPGPHNVANALAAAALARAHGVPAAAVAAGLRAFRPDPHRNATVEVVGGITYVDDSKATNPHAAGASLSAYRRVVWIAGGQLKGANVDELVATHWERMVGVVLLGADREVIRDSLARHAPDLPVSDVAATDDTAMVQVVRAAAGLARPGDTVLLAPAAASLDMFGSYGARGDAFAAAVRELAAR
ncbi:MAG TPA: UDP-N-acetylmuramoyl-L-alanine--D-glutamate ligase [Mycobacteriales bacterium]|nr:UDP-N-acetylmuramoyl-L-alanine--D-glutamate ligase [Mycobacteriales bacterium]